MHIYANMLNVLKVVSMHLERLLITPHLLNVREASQEAFDKVRNNTEQN